MNKTELFLATLAIVFSAIAEAEHHEHHHRNHHAKELDTNKLSDAANAGLSNVNSTIDKIDDHFDEVKANTDSFFDTSKDSTGTYILKSIVVVIGIAAGIFVAGFGYKHVKPVVFVSAFSFGGLFFSAFLGTLVKNNVVPIIGFFVGGLLIGALAVYFYRAGIFLVGAAAASLLGLVFAAAVKTSDVVAVIVIAVNAIIGGILALYLEKPAIIASSSYFGASVIIRGIGFFGKNYPNGIDFSKVDSIPAAWWWYWGGAVLIFLISVYIQVAITAKGINHGLDQNKQKEAEEENAAKVQVSEKPVNMV